MMKIIHLLACNFPTNESESDLSLFKFYDSVTTLITAVFDRQAGNL